MNISNTIVKSKRNSNIELLRILSMLLIVLSHVTLHGIWFPPETPITTPFLLSHVFQCWSGMIGNWIFVLISGYFICTSSFSWKKVLILYFQIISISVFFGLIVYFSKIPVIGWYNYDYDRLGFFGAARPATLKELIRCFFPLYFCNNWFAVQYLIFYLFVPFLNILIKNLDQKNHFKLIAIMFIIGFVIHQIPFQNIFKQSNLFNFMTGYFVASYIRFYDPKILNHKKFNIFASIFFIAFFISWNFIVYKYLSPIPFIKNHFEDVLGFFAGSMARVVALICAVLILCVFKNINIGQSNFINKTASATFGVYLIHEQGLICKLIWHRFLKIDNFTNTNFILLYMIFAAILVYSICTIIELIRKQTLEKLFISILNKLSNKDSSK